MAPVVGLLRAVVGAISFVSWAKSDHDSEVRRPMLSEDGDETSGRIRRPTKLDRSMWKSDSVVEVCKLARTDGLSNVTVQAPLFSKPPTTPGEQRRTSRPNARRAISSPRIETLSSSFQTAHHTDTTTQHDIKARLSHIRDADGLKRKQSQCEGSSEPGRTDDRYGTDIGRRSSTRSSSHPDLRRTTRATGQSDSTPVKSCLEKNAKSADATPTYETTTLFEKALKDQKLRRRKTVEFAEAFPDPDVAKDDTVDRFEELRRQSPVKSSKRTAVCPRTAMLERRSLASPAVTRTDVHVIAITPSVRSAVERAELDKTAESPATPTMQVAESRNGAFEVVWDDIPPEHNVRNQRRSSSAGHVLGALSGESKGLERVNTKLTEWSGSWNTPSEQFKPTIVVFPDDDGWKPRFDCAVTHEHMGTFAPPNSERASASHSRSASRPASAHMSRAPSQDDHCTLLSEHSPFLVRSPVMPDPETLPAHPLAAHRKLIVPSSERKLSNIDEADIRFRDHRDSVTLAHSRLIKDGGVRPELFAHRDSVTLAKKRMYARNHTASTNRQLHRLKAKSEPDSLPVGDAETLTPLSVIKAHAADALSDEAPLSILRRTDETGEHHIQFEA